MGRWNLRAKGFFAAIFVIAPLATAADVPIIEWARRHFKAGVAFLKDQDGEKVEEAYREFIEAYAISKSPKVLGNIGFCSMKMERDGEAIGAYSRYLREVTDIDETERKQITQDLETLTVSVVRLTLTFNRPGVTLTDIRTPVKGDKVTNIYKVEGTSLNIGVRAGNHVVRAHTDGAIDATWEVEAHAGTKETHAFELKTAVTAPPPPVPTTEPPRETPISPPTSRPNVLPWVVVGTGGALVVAGGVTGLVALSKTNKISSTCKNDQCPSSFDLNGARSSARTFVTSTDVLWISGTLVAAGGLVWWLMTRGHKESSLPAASAACDGRGCYGSLHVRF